MKAIFLDFDGVLNNIEWMMQFKANDATYYSYFEKSAKELDPSRVKMISDLAVETDSSIVVSSSWRLLHELHELRDLLETRGMDPKILPRSVTPDSSRRFRGDEIDMWLQVNPDYKTHVIFDDDGDFYPHQPLVQTSWEVGLLPTHIDAARKILLNI